MSFSNPCPPLPLFEAFGFVADETPSPTIFDAAAAKLPLLMAYSRRSIAPMSRVIEFSRFSFTSFPPKSRGHGH
jgi:hypothetical protein